jgi:hypothetical protein
LPSLLRKSYDSRVHLRSSIQTAKQDNKLSNDSLTKCSQVVYRTWIFPTYIDIVSSSKNDSTTFMSILSFVYQHQWCWILIILNLMSTFRTLSIPFFSVPYAYLAILSRFRIETKRQLSFKSNAIQTGMSTSIFKKRRNQDDFYWKILEDTLFGCRIGILCNFKLINTLKRP